MPDSTIAESTELIEVPAVPSTTNTVVPRYMAATLDNVVAMLLAVIAGKAITEDYLPLQVVVVVTVFLAYYFVSETLISRTPGKLLAGLVVVDMDGGRCSWQQIAIRTATRLFEVNPLLLGAIPAALSVVFSRHHQRFGDKWAETLVVESRRRR